MEMHIRFRPTTAEDFILKWGEWQLCFASEEEVYREFDRVEKSVPANPILRRLKQISLQLVQRKELECDPLVSAAYLAFQKHFPAGIAI